MSDDLQERLSGIRLVALDVDGVLTDGSIVYAQNGQIQSFSVLDGLGMKLLREVGVELAWITGRDSRATRRRAAELSIEELHTEVRDKARTLADVQARHGFPIGETLAMGDDLPDLALATRAAVFAAPGDARPEVRARADLVTVAGGGRGAVREMAEAVLQAKGLWEELVGRYGRAAE